MKPSVHLYLLLLLIDFTSLVYSVPHEFCLDHFDGADCGKAPTYVFHYYKSGSRCEIVKWRGCPTRNRFPDEFLCSHYCIGRLMGRVDESEEDGYNSIENYIDSVTKEEWVEEIKDLKIEDIQVLDAILDEVVKETNHKLQKLVLKKTTEAPFESMMEAELPTKAAIVGKTEAAPSSPHDNGGGVGGIGSVEEVVVP